MNPTSLISDTARAVSTRDHEGRPANVVTVSRAYSTSVDDLWDAMTNAERIPRWFLPITGDLRLGGRYQLQGNAGGTVTECDPPRAFSLTWEFGGAVSWVTVRLTGEGRDRTLLTLEHIAHPDDHWAKYGPGATGVGWDLALMGLAEHLTGKPKLEPAQAAAWMGSADGKAVMTASSAAWADAAIAAGAPEDEARAAGARTTAAYTGE
jgi:uncharacterized protein YndB with AHSA1/START domain